MPVLFFAQLLAARGSVALLSNGFFIELIVVCLAGMSTLAMVLAAACRRRQSDGTLCHRSLIVARLAVQLAVAILTAVVGIELIRAVGGYPHAKPQWVAWLALLSTLCAVILSLWDRRARFGPAALYCLGWAALSLGQLQRGYAPGRFFIWGAMCEWAALAMIAALVGWLFRRFSLLSRGLRLPEDRIFWPDRWFSVAQAGLVGGTALVAGWIALDVAFDGMGQGVAVFGLAGRQATCPAALMLVGTAILMAWQSCGRWRAVWQYAAMTAGVLFTSSIGWSRLEATASDGEPLWLAGSTNLAISAAMMTLLTRFGLARVLPGSGDWIPRARRAAPFFGGLAVAMLALLALGICLR